MINIPFVLSRKRPKLKTRRTSFSPHLCSVDVTQQEYESKHSQNEEDDSIFGEFSTQSAFFLCPMIRLHVLSTAVMMASLGPQCLIQMYKPQEGSINRKIAR